MMEDQETPTTQRDASGAAPIGVLLVTDEIVLRAGLRMLLESWPEVRIAGEAGKTSQALAIAFREKPDVALCDGDPASSEANSDFLSKLVRAMGAKKIILLTENDSPADRLKAIGTGVNGIVCKGRAFEELRMAVAKVHAGELWLDRLSAARFILQRTRQFLADTPDPARAKIDSLTERERQIAQLICQGLQNEEIGKRLSISDTTVRHHLTSIFARIGVTTRLALTVFLYRNNFTGSSVDRDSGFFR